MRVGLITGSGSCTLPAAEAGSPEEVQTPFGPAFLSPGRMDGVEVLHVSRHRAGHRLLSNQVDHRSNIWALRDRGADCVVAATVCGAVDPHLPLGSLMVFDDLHFSANRLPDGSLCTLHVTPGARGRGHWIFDRPFSEPLRRSLLEGGRHAGHRPVDGGCYGHVDGPRFNSRAEIRSLAQAGVTAVSQTAAPEAVLCGEAELPYALLGYMTDYANGVAAEATPVEEILRLVNASNDVIATTLLAAVARLDATAVEPVGTHFRFD